MTLAGLNILVVEDDPLIADIIAGMVEHAGGRIVGPFATMIAALENLDYTNAIDVAILDIGLGSETSYPLAEALKTTRIPFLFVTGRERADLPDTLSSCFHLKKPFTAVSLVQALERCVHRS